MSKKHSTSSGRHVKRALTATSSIFIKMSMVWTTKKLGGLCVRFPKRKYHFLTTLQFMTWTGRRDKRGLPIYLFNMKYLTSNLEAHYLSCGSLSTSRPTRTGLPPAATLRSLAVSQGIVRFVLPLCSLIRKRPSPAPIFQATVIADISAVSLVQIWRISSWIQFFSKVLTDAYLEILDRVIVS